MCDRITNSWVSRGHGYREIAIKCGNTLPDGCRAICDPCLGDPAALAEIDQLESLIADDNAWAASAGWGEF
jgi:hypothetical protein